MITKMNYSTRTDCQCDVVCIRMAYGHTVNYEHAKIICNKKHLYIIYIYNIIYIYDVVQLTTRSTTLTLTLPPYYMYQYTISSTRRCDFHFFYLMK